MLLGFVVWGDVPAPRLLAGAALIMGAGLYIVWREHVLARAT
jgi:drug/metabolite transporter (DMT)-like permease